MGMRQVNWGVLGTANIAKTQTIPAMLKADNCKLYGVAGRSKDKVDEFKKLFGFEQAYYDLAEM
jgi:predicted dehydrogenase